jgi:hypothetical protein
VLAQLAGNRFNAGLSYCRNVLLGRSHKRGRPFSSAQVTFGDALLVKPIEFALVAIEATVNPDRLRKIQLRHPIPAVQRAAGDAVTLPDFCLG